MLKAEVLFAMVIVLSGCSAPALRTAAEAAGIMEAPPLPAFVIDLDCDQTSTACTEEHLQVILAWVAPFLSEHPGSTLRLFAQGDDLTSTRLVAQATSTPPPNPAVSVVRAHQASFRTTLVRDVLASARPLWHARRHASPIAESLAGIASFPTEGERIIVLLADLREESASRTDAGYGSFECGHLPTPEAWAQRTKRLFASLQGARIIVLFASPLEPIDGNRCSVTLDRWRQLQDLWHAALTTNGARVSFYPDAPPTTFSALLERAQ